MSFSFFAHKIKFHPLMGDFQIHHCICSHNTFYIGKTKRSFKTRYNEHVSKKNYKKLFPKSNFAKHVLKHNHKIHFDIEKYLTTINI